MAIPLAPKLKHAITKRVRMASKRAIQQARWRHIDKPRVLFIVGCQRSGTTLMVRLFDADIGCRVFGEYSELSSADKVGRIRLNPLPDVAATIYRVRAPLVVAKPLVETQRIRTLLNYFPASKALFMYRRYADVAKSDLEKFGLRNGVDNLRPIVEGHAHNWRSAGASPGVREIVRRHYSESMNPHDAAALFWFARNQLFFDLGLDRSADVLLCQYEHFTQDAVGAMRRIYNFVGLPAPDLSHTAEVRSTSVRRGGDLQFSAPVAAICEQLQQRLDALYDERLAGATVKSKAIA